MPAVAAAAATAASAAAATCAETNLIAECSRWQSAKSCQQQFSIVNSVRRDRERAGGGSERKRKRQKYIAKAERKILRGVSAEDGSAYT